MPIFTLKLPDIGEGIAQAELTGWCIAIGDLVVEEAPLAEVMTDKATVEIPSPVSGRVIWLGGEVGETLAIGCDLIRNAVEDDANQTVLKQDPSPVAMQLSDQKASANAAFTSERRTLLTGLRRVIADRMQATTNIPQFTIVEEVDVTSLLALREQLNAAHPRKERLTVLPFLIRALSTTLADHPQINAHLIEHGTTLIEYPSVHCGIATQTDEGLMVPVLRDVQALEVWQIAKGISRLATACRAGTISRTDLAGSTITVSSLGALGGLSTTPIINAPEVAVVGINRITIRPVWNSQCFAPRQLMNLSCSFDHRVVDGWAAAHFIAQLKSHCEAITREGH
jgi:2-oxoisovalerate dehydrogenase E2 component (dihydrolipoyl transacylase)